MNTRLLILLAGTLFVPGKLLAQNTAFSYQGQLNAAGSPANGIYEMYFTLHDAPTNGNVVGTAVTVAPLPVTNGLFTTMLDFGADAFTGGNRWLGIAVTVFGSDQPVTPLVPRQPVAPAPYALHAANAAGLMTFANAPLDIKVNGQRVLRLEAEPGSAPNVIGGAFVNGVAPGVLGATIGGGGTASPGFEATNRVEASFGTISGGAANIIHNLSRHGTIGGGWQNAIRADSGWGAIGGGESNTIESNARYSTIGGGGLNKAGAFGCVIAGGSLNTIQANAEHASIGGGLRNLIAGNAISGTIAGGDANISSGDYGTIGGGEGNIASGAYATIGGGYANAAGQGAATIAGGANNSASGDYAFVGGGGGNSSSGYMSNVGGGEQNSASDLWATVGGGTLNRSIGENATVAGGAGNSSSGFSSTVAGGYFNRSSRMYSTVAGGRGNSGDGDFSTVGGGEANSNHGDASVIGGGTFNLCNGHDATIGGGFANSIEMNASYATIGGGTQNTILPHASYATIPGGRGNTAGFGALAAGFNARATNDGSFVWSDGGGTETGSLNDNSVTFRARGGYRLFTDNSTSGVSLAPGSGTWASLSDRHAKENITAADTRDILDKVAALPMAAWNYKAQSKEVRHLGPMAQDFHAAFGLGESDRTITTVDADGVALAAIQGVNSKLEEALKARDSRIAELEQRLLAIEKLLASLGRVTR